MELFERMNVHLSNYFKQKEQRFRNKNEFLKEKHKKVRL